MPLFRRVPRGAGAVSLVLTAVDLWSRLTPTQRRRLLEATRKHGPKVARAAARRARARRGR